MFEKFGPWKFVKELYRQAREHFIDRPERFKRWNDETQAGLAAEEEFLTDGHNHKLEERMKIWGNLEIWSSRLYSALALSLLVALRLH